MIVVCDIFNPCDLLPCHFNTITPFDKLWCPKPCLFSNSLSYEYCDMMQMKSFILNYFD